MKQAKLSFAGRASNPTKASPAQLAARKRFAEMARSGAFKKATKRKANPEPTHDFAKIGKPFAWDGRTWKVSQYAHTGKTIEAFTTDRKSPYRRETLDVAMLMSPRRKINPLPPVVETILEQMGGNKFMVMTGARPVVHGPHMLTFKLPTNQSKANYLDVIHNPGKDLYTMTFRRVSNRGMDSKNLVEYDDVYADQLQPMFEKVTGMYTTLGTMGRKVNPTKKTVSQKISQLVHEGYPQRQAVAVALSEQRSGKVKRNPGKVKYRNLATDLKGDQRVGYSVHLASQPGHNAIAWFSKKADALEVAQEAADRTGKQLAVTRVQNYFGAM